MPETLKVASTDVASQGDFVEINASDFDLALHTLYAPEPQAEEAPKPAWKGKKAIPAADE